MALSDAGGVEESRRDGEAALAEGLGGEVYELARRGVDELEDGRRGRVNWATRTILPIEDVGCRQDVRRIEEHTGPWAEGEEPDAGPVGVGHLRIVGLERERALIIHYHLVGPHNCQG